jgi:hypothetical protein
MGVVVNDPSLESGVVGMIRGKKRSNSIHLCRWFLYDYAIRVDHESITGVCMEE